MHEACEEIPGSSLDSEFVDTGIKHVNPIFEDLSKDDLLSLCLHEKTQNQNESFRWYDMEPCAKATFHKTEDI